MSGDVTIGALKRLSAYLAGQLASAVAITGGTVSASLRDSTVETGSTTANLSATGVSLLGSTVGVTYTADAPVVGGYKYIRNTTSATNVVYSGSTLISIGSSSTLTRLTMTGASSVILKGETTGRWGLYSAYPSTLIALSS